MAAAALASAFPAPPPPFPALIADVYALWEACVGRGAPPSVQACTDPPRCVSSCSHTRRSASARVRPGADGASARSPSARADAAVSVGAPRRAPDVGTASSSSRRAYQPARPSGRRSPREDP
eukprot:27597-Chlamydomonas_euryale.AAC.9